MTKREAQSDAKAQGARAVFIREEGAREHHATKKSPVQLQREIDEVLSRAPKGRVHHATMTHPTSTGQGVDAFWDIYEEELVRSVAEKPGDYALRADEPPEVYARRIRDSFQKLAEEKGIGRINLDSNTFKRVAKRIGVAKFSQGRLKDAYAAYGGRATTTPTTWAEISGK